MDNVDTIKFRGNATNLGPWLNKFSTIINVYNHNYEDLSKYGYLDGYEESRKLKAYILGTISHEVGHHFYNKVLKLSERKEYEKICREEKVNESVTLYVEKYKNGTLFGNIEEEDFTESIRRFVTNYGDFKKEFPKRVKFIENKFPEIKGDGIKDFV